MSHDRVIYLRPDQVRQIDHWCSSLQSMFYPCSTYLVGSVLEVTDWRDIDIRIVISDERFEALPMALRDLNMLLSMWGGELVGLPIDCQLQSTSIQTSEHDAEPRNPRGIAQRGSG